MSLKQIYLILFCMALVFGTSASYAQPAESAENQDTVNLSLDEAIKLALENNEKAKISKEEIEKAKATVMENAAAAWPQLTAIAGYTYNIEQPVQVQDMPSMAPLFQAMQLPAPPDTEIPLVYKHEWQFTGNVKQNIYTFGRIYNAIKLAKTYENISEENDVLTREEIIYEVREAYYNVILAKEALAIAVENFKISEDHYNNVLAKQEAGIRSDFDLLQSKAELAEAKPAVISAQTSVTIAEKYLLNILGLPMNKKVNNTDSYVEFYPAQSLDQLLDVAYSNRKELKLTRLQEKMNHTTANLYISNYLPVLAAEMNYTWTGNSISDEDAFWPEEDDDWFNFWSVGVTFTWPFFDGLESYAKIRQYRAEERISRLQQAQLTKGIELELTQIVNEFESLKQQVQARKETVAVAEKAFELAAIRYDNGLGTALEKNDAQVMMMRAKLGYLQTLHNLNLTRANLAKALGKEIDEL